MYTLKVTEEFGRGLYATNKIAAGTCICKCEVLKLGIQDTIVINEYTHLKHYTFKYDELSDCLVLGDGEIFNHSDTANVIYKLVDVDSRTASLGESDAAARQRKVMLFIAVNPINEGEQLFINYNADVGQVDTDSYKENKSLM